MRGRLTGGSKPPQFVHAAVGPPEFQIRFLKLLVSFFQLLRCIAHTVAKYILLGLQLPCHLPDLTDHAIELFRQQANFVSRMGRDLGVQITRLSPRHSFEKSVNWLINELPKQQISAQHGQEGRDYRHPNDALDVTKRYRPDTVEVLDNFHCSARTASRNGNCKYSV